MHAAHLQEILQPIVNYENKGPVTISICDGGPDWSTKFTPNLINYGQLWSIMVNYGSLNLDVLILTCYAPAMPHRALLGPSVKDADGSHSSDQS